MASLFSICGLGLPKENKVETLLYFKNELKLLGPICSWSHSENIALYFTGTESGPFASMWLGSDERQAKNGTLSPRVTSHPPPHFLSLSFSLVLSIHISSQVNIRHFATEMKELSKKVQSKTFLLSQKDSFAFDRKAPHQELFSLSCLQK